MAADNDTASALPPLQPATTVMTTMLSGVPKLKKKSDVVGAGGGGRRFGMIGVALVLIVVASASLQRIILGSIHTTSMTTMGDTHTETAASSAQSINTNNNNNNNHHHHHHSNNNVGAGPGRDHSITTTNNAIATATAAATTASVYYNRTLTLIAVLRGEMGNNLGVLAMARWMQRFVERELPGILVHIVAEHQKSNKWMYAKSDIKACFPNLRNLDFKGGIWDTTGTFFPIRSQQRAWLGRDGLQLVNIETMEQIQYLKSLLDQQRRRQQQVRLASGTGGGHAETTNNSSSNINSSAIPLPTDPLAPYSLPYLTATGFAIEHAMIHADFYYDLRQHYLAFDTDACCKPRTQQQQQQQQLRPGESVFHFRNFVSEIRKDGFREAKGMMELSPKEAAGYLFADNALLLGGDNNSSCSSSTPHHNNNPTSTTKQVAIISRFANSAGNYAKALQARGWEARVVGGKSAVYDFCLAMNTTSSLVGLEHSTYVVWAGILGNASIVRLYTVGRQQRQTRQQKQQQQQTLAHVLPDQRRVFKEFYTRHEILRRSMLQ